LNDKKKAEKLNEKICPICLEDFSPELKRKILDCGHSFCSSCIVKIENCPLCRMEIDRGTNSPKSQTNQNAYTQAHFDWQLSQMAIIYPDYISGTQIQMWSDHSSINQLQVHETTSNENDWSDWGGGGGDGGGGSGGSW